MFPTPSESLKKIKVKSKKEGKGRKKILQYQVLRGYGAQETLLH